MKLWTFLFPSAASLYRSARVAAPDRHIAVAILTAAIEEGLERDVLCQYAGEVPAEAPKVLELIARGAER